MARSELAAEVDVVAAGPVTAAEVMGTYAQVLAEWGADRCCPLHPAGLTPAEAVRAARRANMLIASLLGERVPA
jgi:hypothetical protein